MVAAGASACAHAFSAATPLATTTSIARISAPNHQRHPSVCLICIILLNLQFAFRPYHPFAISLWAEANTWGEKPVTVLISLAQLFVQYITCAPGISLGSA